MTKQPDWADACLECGASLSFLRDHPRRVGFAIWFAMLAGLALLVALLTRLLDEFLAGGLPRFGWIEAIELSWGVIMSLLGARAWTALRDMVLQRMPSHSRR